MQTAGTLFDKTWLHPLWLALRTRYRFKYVLPKIQEITLEGLRFDVSSLSPKARNRLLSGAYEAPEKAMCLDFLNANDAVVEIGAAIGFIGLICQKIIGIQNYSSFEANPKTSEVLRRNYALNGIEPRVWNMALAHADGFVELEVGGDFWENSTCFDHDRRDGAETVRVPAGTLDSLLRLAAHRVNTLIIDVEGAERFIDPAGIPAAISKIIIELHPRIIGQEATCAIVARLIGLGFRVARKEQDTMVFLRE